MTQVAITNDHTNVLHAASASDVSEDELCSFPSIHTKAEEIKKQLTYSEEVGFNCTLLVSDVIEASHVMSCRHVTRFRSIGQGGGCESSAVLCAERARLPRGMSAPLRARSTACAPIIARFEHEEG